MGLRVYNTYSRKLEEFVPIRAGQVGFYVCGPTVYDYFHIGNARCFVMFDIIRKYLEFKGYAVTFVENITDIDDKIIKKARELGIPPATVAERFAVAFMEDSERLRIKAPSVHPRATEHIEDMVGIIEMLIKRGYAYEADGDVFFEVEKFADYGRLSGKNIETLRSGERVEVDKRKRNPLDFVLWKTAKPGEPTWNSPWGAGRPGWHIECSAMSMKYLGEEFDIHAGAEDLIFPHHENEIAQSACSTGKRFARYWLHLGFLNINREKMSKSLGNFLNARDVLKQYRPEALRLFYAQKHYRSLIDFSEDALEQSEKAVDRLYRGYRRLRDFLEKAGENGVERAGDNTGGEQGSVAVIREEIISAMDNDFDTPAAVAKIFDLFRITNAELDAIEKNATGLTAEKEMFLREALQVAGEADEFLGIIPESDKVNQSDVADIIGLLIDIRGQLRKRKIFDLADYIRTRLEEVGFVLEDAPTGTTWRRK